MFDKPLASYKKKDELVTIAGALQILTTGTNPELIERIRDHLHQNPQLKQNHRFAGLFNMSRRRGPVQSARETTPIPATPPSSHHFPQFLPSETHTGHTAHTSCWQAVLQSPAPHMRPKPRPITRIMAQPAVVPHSLSYSSLEIINPLTYNLSSFAGSSSGS